ncbi:RHS repeat-associated core domain-containing protein [Acinetobacter guillouiae]|jgi:RHS repeat-associated protein|uniref:RHS repeat domain-containing protein n=1 Tax=Acinetobacter guillouiae TaxID=106649 RepID=UPI002E1C3D6A
MKTKMKNNNMQPNKIWLITVQLIVLSLFLVLSQLTLAKDRIQYHVQNFDGSTLKVINEQGVVSQSYQYAPFGQQLQYKKPSNLKNPNAFVGGVQDADDLIYLKQRHYNPVLGRFYQPDPVTFIMKGHGQTNRYQYGWNDTYSFNDPSGQAAQLAFVPLVLWIADNLRSDTPNANNLPPSGIGDAAVAGYGGASLLFSARLASMSTAELSYYNIVQNGASISPVLWLTSGTSNLYNPTYVYQLSAAESGFYPIMKWGFKEPQGGVWLEAGQLWKIGETIHPATRYSTKELANTGRGLDMEIISKKGLLPADGKAIQNQYIRNYREVYGELPPGNKGVK